MVPKSDITGLILAGGAGRRVGYRDKGLIVWQGKPLVAHVYACLEPQVGEVLISCNRNFARYALYGARAIADCREDYQGPLAGIEAASRHVKTALLVVTSCDMPRLPRGFVSRLTEPFSRNSGCPPEITYAHDGERAQYLCAAIRRDCLPSLTRYLDEGNRAVYDWYASRNSISVDFADQQSSFSNHNRPG